MAKKWTTVEIPDQTGRVVVVTGASSGIGIHTAGVLAVKGAKVILACRNEAKAEAVRSRIGRHSEVLLLDLANLSSIRDATDKFRASNDRLDLLINNAGVMEPRKRKETADGFEMQFGTNHLGHFALTGLLLDMLLATPDSRVVTVSSALHSRGQLNLDDLQSEMSYGGMGAYAQSKLANLLFTYHLQRMLSEAGAGTTALACHPGLTNTGLAPVPISWAFAIFGQRSSQGALSTLLAATGQQVDGGQYFGPGEFGGRRGSPKRVKSSDRSHDTELADRLWAVSEELTGVTYEIPEAG